MPSLRATRSLNDPWDWVRDGEELWHAPGIAGNPGPAALDGCAGRERPSPDSLERTGDYHLDASRARLYMRCPVNPAERGAEVAEEDFVIGPVEADHLVFSGLDLRLARTTVFQGWGGLGLVLRNCRLLFARDNLVQHNNHGGGLRLTGCLLAEWNLGNKRAYAVQAIDRSGPVDIEICRFEAVRSGGGDDHTDVMNDDRGWVRTVRGCAFLGRGGNLADEGVVLWRLHTGADEAVVASNLFIGLGGSAVEVQEPGFRGARPRIQVRGNRIEGAVLRGDLDKEALRVRGVEKGVEVTVIGNVIRDTPPSGNEHNGVELRSSTGVAIRGNRVSGAHHGLRLAGDTEGVVVEDNVLTGNRGYGLSAFPGSDAKLRGNRFSGNRRGRINGIARGVVAEPARPETPEAAPKPPRTPALPDCLAAGDQLP
ncbi:right-handed parallel beta-helix repeat-containing protein [Desulfohalovibrio reitneri]|uniref:right-handed parallel beta-helix repeat-containing protein n=1 Tax=Desulfohalovibrio reitneri TaxID=1307759 RepID=UPI0004A72EB3|nr:right-handed parallel beta-helix repeat-containing protein [Desulfohalovibrio reitneri]